MWNILTVQQQQMQYQTNWVHKTLLRHLKYVWIFITSTFQSDWPKYWVDRKQLFLVSSRGSSNYITLSMRQLTFLHVSLVYLHVFLSASNLTKSNYLNTRTPLYFLCLYAHKSWPSILQKLTCNYLYVKWLIKS